MCGLGLLFSLMSHSEDKTQILPFREASIFAFRRPLNCCLLKSLRVCGDNPVSMDLPAASAASVPKGIGTIQYGHAVLLLYFHYSFCRFLLRCCIYRMSCNTKQSSVQF